nr:MAG: hypothetical protein [Tombusviridae sp.]
MDSESVLALPAPELPASSEPNFVLGDTPAPTESTIASRPAVQILFDLDVTARELDNMLCVDAQELDIVEENLLAEVVVRTIAPVVHITKFCQTWFRKAFRLPQEDTTKVEVLRETVLMAMEEAHEDPRDYVETHLSQATKTTYYKGLSKTEVLRTRTSERLVKGYRSKFAASLAQEVKLKFSTLKYTEANRLMVARWLSNHIAENFKDLRTVDKVLAMERATFMAFLVSDDFARFKVLFETEPIKDRLLAHFGQE